MNVKRSITTCSYSIAFDSKIEMDWVGRENGKRRSYESEEFQKFRKQSFGNQTFR